MFAPIDPKIKEKIISAYLAGGQGRNQITRDLNGQGLRVSHGSVSNIISAYKRKQSPQQQQSSQLQPSPPQKQQEAQETPVGGSSTTLNIMHAIIADTGHAPSFNPGDGLKPEPDPKIGGPAPLSLLNKIINPTAISAPIATTSANNSAPIETDEDIPDSHSQPPAFPDFQERKPERPSSKWKNQIDIGDIDYTHHANAKTEEIEEVTTTEESEVKIRSGLSDSEDNEPIADDWDPDQEYRTRFFKAILDEREQRQNELRLIQHKRYELNQEMQSIEQQRHDLEVRENRLQEVEPLIPSVKQLQSMGITFDLMFPYIETINEKAVTENLDLKTAAYNLAHDLREYRQLGSLHKSIEKAKQQLSVLDAFTAQNQAAVTTVMNLQLAGFSEKDINELIGLVTAWNKSGIGGPGLSQGNGSSSMNGSKLDDKLIGIGH
jgi:hypothetical protein